jgi:hypothetical protein
MEVLSTFLDIPATEIGSKELSLGIDLSIENIAKVFARFFTGDAEVVMESILDASGLSNGKTAMMGGLLSRTCSFNKFLTVITSTL